MKFFKLNIETGLVELVRDELTLYPNIREIIRRDKGGKITGDPDGRKKLYAYNEFTYIYHTCDFDAYPSQHGFTDAEAHRYALKNTSLPEQYEADPIVRTLMEQYKKEHLTQGKKTIKSILRTFSFNSIIIDNITDNLKLMVSNTSLTKDQISELIKYQQQLLLIATEIPKQVKLLREAMALVQDEEEEIQILRGGAEVPSSMNPNNKIEND